MSTATSAPLRLLLQEGTEGQELDDARRAEVIEALLVAGFSVTSTRGTGQVAAADASHLVLLGEGVSDAAPGKLVGETAAGANVDVRVLEIRGLAPEAIVAAVEQTRAELGAYVPGEWKPWFPVIDYQRCTNCMQCLSFCLFDVYGVDADSEIEVRNPDKCKTNCPACSRVCPEVAILFPKYNAGPINGDEVKEADVEREKMKVDVSALLGGDIYSMLRERHERAASRFSKERDETKALKERMRCLKKLQGDLDIPQEVLMSLPSLDQIKQKAEAAAERSAGEMPPPGTTD